MGIILTRKDAGPLPQPLPDGLENLAEHNVLTFKSHQEALDGWALCELVGHYVNHRKQRTPPIKNLLPEANFRLYAVCVRYPHNLAQEVPLTRLRKGVYEVPLVTLRIRVIVVQQLPQQEQNALFHLFSSQVEQVRYGRQHYQARTKEMTTLLYDLLQLYREDAEMSDALKEYAQTRLAELLKDIPPEKRLEGISPEKRLEGLSPEQVIQALPPEELAGALEAIQQRLRTRDSSTDAQ